MTVAQELKELVGIEVKTGETASQFALRLLKKADQLPQDAWEAMSTPAQTWVNVAIEANLDKQPIPLPEGIDAAMVEKKVDGVEMASSKTTKAKKPKDKKPSKSAKASEGAKRGPKARFDETGKIKVLVAENPKRKGSESAARFDKYKTGQTVAQVLNVGVTLRDLRWDVEAGFIEIA